MYIFSRSTVLSGAGNTRDAQLWVANVTEKVNQITDLQLEVWRNVFSREVGRLTWVAFVEDLAQLESADDKLQADDAFVALTDRGSEFTNGTLDDVLEQVVYTTADLERSVQYANTVTALMAPGKFARGIELGIEICERAEQITGEPTMLVSNVTGDYAGISWVTGYDSVQGMQTAGEKLNANPSFVHFIDNETPGVYESGLNITQQTCYRKVL
jgi:hypothetical protein